MNVVKAYCIGSCDKSRKVIEWLYTDDDELQKKSVAHVSRAHYGCLVSAFWKGLPV